MMTKAAKDRSYRALHYRGALERIYSIRDYQRGLDQAVARFQKACAAIERREPRIYTVLRAQGEPQTRLQLARLLYLDYDQLSDAMRRKINYRLHYQLGRLAEHGWLIPAGRVRNPVRPKLSSMAYLPHPHPNLVCVARSRRRLYRAVGQLDQRRARALQLLAVAAKAKTRSPREKAILERYREGQSHAEIAVSYKLSRERIRQILCRAIPQVPAQRAVKQGRRPVGLHPPA